MKEINIHNEDILPFEIHSKKEKEKKTLRHNFFVWMSISPNLTPNSEPRPYLVKIIEKDIEQEDIDCIGMF